jgi:hypothetical protein
MALPMGVCLRFANAALVALGLPTVDQAQQANMSFFVTGVCKGNGADLGGLEGAGAHCLALARAAGSTGTNWRVSEHDRAGGEAGVNARERIGKGPWENTKGVVVANNLIEMHPGANNHAKQTALTEKGELVSGRGDPVNNHDVLTGSGPQGPLDRGRRHDVRKLAKAEGSAIVGYHDRTGLKDIRHMKSWKIRRMVHVDAARNSSNPREAQGCSIVSWPTEAPAHNGPLGAHPKCCRRACAGPARGERGASPP